MAPRWVTCFSKTAVLTPFMLLMVRSCQPSMKSPWPSEPNGHQVVAVNSSPPILLTEGAVFSDSSSPGRKRENSFGIRRSRIASLGLCLFAIQRKSGCRVDDRSGAGTGKKLQEFTTAKQVGAPPGVFTQRGARVRAATRNLRSFSVTCRLPSVYSPPWLLGTPGEEYVCRILH